MQARVYLRGKNPSEREGKYQSTQVVKLQNTNLIDYMVMKQHNMPFVAGTNVLTPTTRQTLPHGSLMTQGVAVLRTTHD
jgi:hypothetical protein